MKVSSLSTFQYDIYTLSIVTSITYTFHIQYTVEYLFDWCMKRSDASIIYIFTSKIV